MYKWNRTKCIRAIASADSMNCAIPKERVQAHFQEIWEKPANSNELPEVPPPASSPESSQRPPVLEFISPKVVAACLKSAENSAPGPDLISYKHWRKIDPTCTMLKNRGHPGRVEGIEHHPDPQG
ncbi:hypothetical protein TNCV_746961 [Trichonephila clavipes]|nr:hypothetical protein TNCV_701471 [Trichonephila clavipes]GFX38915.1 hypothetical protein TNCV_746961 [Trichonephila clavipes]